MKVAVVSNSERQVGKTTLSLLLSNIFFNATGKEAAYVTNGSLDEILQLQAFTDKAVTIDRGIDVVTSLSETHNLSNQDILDYAYKSTNVSSLFFDIYNHSINIEDAHNKFIAVVNQLEPRLVLMDLNGGIENKAVENLIEECDVILYLFNPIIKDIKKVGEYYYSLSEDERLKVKLVCNQWNPQSIKKKTIQDILKIRSNSILWFPYHPNIQRAALEGRLCVLNKLIVEGRDSCVELRQYLKDILSFLYDTPKHKVVKEVSKWVV